MFTIRWIKQWAISVCTGTIHIYHKYILNIQSYLLEDPPAGPDVDSKRQIKPSSVCARVFPIHWKKTNTTTTKKEQHLQIKSIGARCILPSHFITEILLLTSSRQFASQLAGGRTHTRSNYEWAEWANNAQEKAAQKYFKRQHVTFSQEDKDTKQWCRC